MYCDSFEDDTDSDPITQALINNAPGIGLPAITEANLLEFCRRLMAWQELTGPLMDLGNITPADIHDRIGLDLDFPGAPLDAATFDARLAHLRATFEEGRRRGIERMGPPAWPRCGTA